MRDKIFCVIFLLLTACGQIKSRSENNTTDSVQDSVKDVIKTDTVKPLPDDNNGTAYDSSLSCEKLLHLLVSGSSFNPEVKKFDFNVGVDEVTDGIATLKVTMRNEERKEDVAIGWLKLNFIKNQLIDVTSDPDIPIKLTYDTMLLRRINKHCHLTKN